MFPDNLQTFYGQPVSIAIDGPAGAGKSTVAREVAKQLGFVYVDTGAMYRVVAWLAMNRARECEHEEEVARLLNETEILFKKNDLGLLDAYVNGKLLGPELRTPEVSTLVSKISVFPKVRQKLTEWQRRFAEQNPVVMDGRDIGTVVLPRAQVKVFLTAKIEERAKRRLTELRDKGFDVTLEELMKSIQERDDRDSNRDVAPLKPADDAYLIDTTGRAINEVVGAILDVVQQVSHG